EAAVRQPGALPRRVLDFATMPTAGKRKASDAFAECSFRSVISFFRPVVDEVPNPCLVLGRNNVEPLHEVAEGGLGMGRPVQGKIERMAHEFVVLEVCDHLSCA